jgi:hypothetical protein
MSGDHKAFFRALVAFEVLVIFGVICLCLGGCAQDPAPVVVSAPPVAEKQRLADIIPGATLGCSPEPNGDKVKTIRQTASYIIGLRAAGDDCRRKLGIVRNVIQNEQ